MGLGQLLVRQAEPVAAVLLEVQVKVVLPVVVNQAQVEEVQVEVASQVHQETPVTLLRALILTLNFVCFTVIMKMATVIMIEVMVIITH